MLWRGLFAVIKKTVTKMPIAVLFWRPVNANVSSRLAKDQPVLVRWIFGKCILQQLLRLVMSIETYGEMRYYFV